MSAGILRSSAMYAVRFLHTCAHRKPCSCYLLKICELAVLCVPLFDLPFSCPNRPLHSLFGRLLYAASNGRQRVVVVSFYGMVRCLARDSRDNVERMMICSQQQERTQTVYVCVCV